MSILVATDLTPRADRALQRAALLARQSATPLTVLHVLEEEWSSAAAARNHAEAERNVATALAALKDGAPEQVSVVVVEGRAYDQILRHAANARMVVIGTRHDPTPTERILGTTIDALARRCEKPLLLVREPVARPYAHAVVGIDSSPCGVAAAKTAMRLFPDCAWRLVHAYEVPFAGFQHGPTAREQAQEDAQNRLNAMVAEEFGPQFGASEPRISLSVQRGEVVEVLCREARTAAADLLVTGTHGRTGIAHAILGSVAQTVLADPPCDVLVVRS